jgi:hypothetical protein
MGSYGVAVRLRGGMVLKVGRKAEGTMDFIEWCMLRMRKFGKGSAEMLHLPEVTAFGRCGAGWWAVMPEYTTAKEFYGDEATYLTNGTWNEEHTYYISYKFEADIMPTIIMLQGIFVDGGWDIHSGNVMWDKRRGQWVIVDPLCNDGSGSAPSLPQPVRFKPKTALWKRNPFQQLRHACR